MKSSVLLYEVETIFSIHPIILRDFCRRVCDQQCVGEICSAGEAESVPQDITQSLSLPAIQVANPCVPSWLLCFILV